MVQPGAPVPIGPGAPRTLTPMARLSSVLVALALVVALAPTATATTVRGDPEPDARLQWSQCHGDAECASLTVPRDYDDEQGPTIEIALVRQRARDPERRIGALVVNPGGPGASGIDYVVGAAGTLPGVVQDRFDIVGFDPRGVGQSSAVDCLDDLDPYFDAEWAPDDEGERRDLVTQNERLVRACERAHGELLPFLRTELVARDMDRIRAALGDEKLTYLGYSYGSYLGTWYAEQFPTRVRALVLDGPVDPQLEGIDFQVQQSVAFEKVLEQFFEHCAQRESCAFHHDGDTAEAYDRLRAEIGATPLPVDSAGEPRMLNGTRFDLAVTQMLYQGEGSFGKLASTLAAADRGDGSDLLFYADFYTGRIDDDSYEDSQEAFLAVGCADGPSVGDVEHMREIERTAAEEAPRLGASIVNGSLACALWPVTPDAPRALHAEGAPPILVVASRHDPATPYAWGVGLVEQLDSGVLVTVRGSRHTSFSSGNDCVDDLVVRYLVRLEAPEADTRC